MHLVFVLEVYPVMQFCELQYDFNGLWFVVA